MTNGKTPSAWTFDEGRQVMMGDYAVPLMVPVELSDEERAAINDPHLRPVEDEPGMFVYLVEYDENNVRGLWRDRKDGHRFLVTGSVQDGYAITGWANFPETHGKWEIWGTTVMSLLSFYERVDGKLPHFWCEYCDAWVTDHNTYGHPRDRARRRRDV